MTAALLVMRIQVADFYELAASVLPLNLHIDVVHIDLLSQRKTQQQPGQLGLSNTYSCCILTVC